MRTAISPRLAMRIFENMRRQVRAVRAGATGVPPLRIRAQRARPRPRSVTGTGRLSGAATAQRSRPASLASYIARSASISSSSPRRGPARRTARRRRSSSRAAGGRRSRPSPARAPPGRAPSATLPASAAVGVGQQHGELVAAEARERVAGAQPLAQQRRDATDELVAGVVAERVVDVLEVVEVEHEQRAARAVARDLGDWRSSSCSKRRRLSSPVSGSWSASWRSSCSKRRRSVMSWICSRKCSGSPVGVAHERDAARDPHDRAVGAQVALLVHRRWQLAVDQRRASTARSAVDVLGVGDGRERRARQLRRPVAGDRAQRLVDVEEAPVERRRPPCRSARPRRRAGSAPAPRRSRARARRARVRPGR